MALLVPLAFPPQQTASFFSTSLVEPQQPFDFISLYIPSNPFHSLANSIVPAVVLFSVILGFALIGIGEKQRLIDVLSHANGHRGVRRPAEWSRQTGSSRCDRRRTPTFFRSTVGSFLMPMILESRGKVPARSLPAARCRESSLPLRTTASCAAVGHRSRLPEIRRSHNKDHVAKLHHVFFYGPLRYAKG